MEEEKINDGRFHSFFPRLSWLPLRSSMFSSLFSCVSLSSLFRFLISRLQVILSLQPIVSQIDLAENRVGARIQPARKRLNRLEI